MRQLHLEQVDNDECRIYFRNEEKQLFCFQLAGRGQFEFFECTSAGEPLAHADFSEYNFGTVDGQDSLIRIGREYNAWWEEHFAEYDVNPNIQY